MAEILKGIRESALIHMGETGRREGGVNGYGWVAATPEGVYFLRRGRNKEMVDELLGAQLCGVVTCDFYAVYNHHPGLKKRCWVHPPRDVDDLADLYPEHTPLSVYKQPVSKLWVQAKEAAAEARPPPSGFAASTTSAQLKSEQRLMELCRHYIDDHSAPQRKLAQCIERSIEELFVSHPGVPSDNNGAERSLRHPVVAHKTSGAPNPEAKTTASRPPRSRRPGSLTSADIGKRLWLSKGIVRTVTPAGELDSRRKCVC